MQLNWVYLCGATSDDVTDSVTACEYSPIEIDRMTVYIAATYPFRTIDMTAS